MATNQNIDKLFSDKLENLSYTPSAEATKLFEQKIKAQKNQTPYYWWSGVVAAVILVLFVWNWHSPKTDPNNSNFISGIVDHPTYVKNNELPEYELRESITINTPKVETRKANINYGIDAKDKKNQVPEKTIYSIEKIYTVATIPAPNSVSIEIPKDVPNATQKLEKSAISSSVKITYIASTAKEEKLTSKFGQIFAMAQKVSDSHPLADIREAKDNLLSRN